MDFPRSRQYFYQEISQADEQINLATAALYIAQEEYPDLDPSEYLNALDTMASDVQERLPAPTVSPANYPEYQPVSV